MVNLENLNIDIPTCKSDLPKFKTLLDSADELGEEPLAKFFREHPHLVLLMGQLALEDTSHYKNEFSIFNEFYADFAICNQDKDVYVFVEFEDAKKDSIFKKVGKGITTTRYEWAKTFEHGYSQVIDWFYRLDDFAVTKKFKEHFGVDEINYSGYLVIGRKKTSIPNFGYQARLDWRSENVIVNGRKVICLTYDELYIELQKKIDEWYVL